MQENTNVKNRFRNRVLTIFGIIILILAPVSYRYFKDIAKKNEFIKSVKINGDKEINIKKSDSDKNTIKNSASKESINKDIKKALNPLDPDRVKDYAKINLLVYGKRKIFENYIKTPRGCCKTAAIDGLNLINSYNIITKNQRKSSALEKKAKGLVFAGAQKYDILNIDFKNYDYFKDNKIEVSSALYILHFVDKSMIVKAFPKKFYDYLKHYIYSNQNRNGSFQLTEALRKIQGNKQNLKQFDIQLTLSFVFTFLNLENLNNEDWARIKAAMKYLKANFTNYKENALNTAMYLYCLYKTGNVDEHFVKLFNLVKEYKEKSFKGDAFYKISFLDKYKNQELPTLETTAIMAAVHYLTNDNAYGLVDYILKRVEKEGKQLDRNTMFYICWLFGSVL